MQKSKNKKNPGSRIPDDYRKADSGIGWGTEKSKYPKVSGSVSGEEEINTD